LRASQHLRALLKHAGRHAGRLVDVCVINTGALATRAVRDYSSRAARPVEYDKSELERMGVEVLAADLVRLGGRRASAKIRHDPGALAAVAIDLALGRASRKLAS
jgi:hypothetical protein